MRLLSIAILSLAASLLMVSAPLAKDLDLGFEIEFPPGGEVGGLDDDCYGFGGTGQSFSGTDRGRGNTYTVFGPETLTEILMELGFTGAANLYFYVLESPTLAGTYTAISETIVPTNGVGQAFYSSGPISVSLTPGMYYGIGVAWLGETITYLRDVASLPRNWALGTVEDAMQISDPPPYTSLPYNHFTGAEYSMELCFLGATPVESSTWGDVKAVYR